MDNTSPAEKDTDVPPLVVNVAEVPEAAKVIVPTLDPFFCTSKAVEPVAAVPALT